jgi:hypothetical protein
LTTIRSDVSRASNSPTNLLSWSRSRNFGLTDSWSRRRATFRAGCWKSCRRFRYDPAGSFRAWLRTVVVNKWHDLRRRAAART